MKNALVLATLALAGLASAADTYTFTLNSAASTAAFDLSVNAPFATGGVSFLLGDYDAVTNPTGTRTIPGLFGGNTGANTPVNITAGGVSAEGNSGPTPLRPRGGFALTLDTAAATAQVAGLTADILNGATVTVAGEVSITYSTFRTRQPTCTLIGGFPITIPAGEGTATALTAAQVDESNSGALAPAGPNQYSFSVPMGMLLVAGVAVNGEPVDVPAQEVPVVFAGTVTVNGATASMTGGFSIAANQTEPGPTPLAALPFTEPLCSGNLLINLTLGSTSIDVSSTVNLVANGTRQAQCDPDFNCDGNADQDDVLCMINVVAGNPGCQCSDPDFNRDGNVDQDDVAAIITAVAGGGCP